MLARMDIISINCPHTPATFHLLSARRLKLLRPQSYVVNTARGEVIDENALIRMIAAGELAGAGLDVFEHEPAVNPKLARLARDGKVVLLPHMGSATRRRPHRHGREGDRQHPHLHGRPQAAGPRAAVDVVTATAFCAPAASDRRCDATGLNRHSFLRFTFAALAHGPPPQEGERKQLRLRRLCPAMDRVVRGNNARPA